MELKADEYTLLEALRELEKRIHQSQKLAELALMKVKDSMKIYNSLKRNDQRTNR